ncbi:MAG: arylsulfatase B [Pseudohongiellaceae bacterium]|jgi:arylsulfatase B
MLTLLACALLTVVAQVREQPGNVLLIIADDLGVDRVGAYGEHPDPGTTPVIDTLAANGVLFRNAWAAPICSPTRASMLTGLHPFRHGITKAIGYANSAVELDVAEVTLPEILPAEYAALAVGKWHVASQQISGLQHPLLSGFDTHLGTIKSFVPSDGPGIYFNYMKNVDGVEVPVSNYASTETVDDALDLIEGETRPWFLWLAFNAPHKPFHKPPADLHTFSLPAGDPDDAPVPHMQASVEAMDREIGRLLSSLRPAVLANTTVIFIGDNGTQGEAVTLPFDSTKAKGSIYEGGVNVPLIVAGKGVPVTGWECSAVVTATDIFATVAELVDGDGSAGIDSISLVPYFKNPDRPPLRRWAFTEKRKPAGFGPYTQLLLAARDQRFKVIYDKSNLMAAKYLFFDLLQDPFETTDLLLQGLNAEQQMHFDRLQTVIQDILAES